MFWYAWWFALSVLHTLWARVRSVVFTLALCALWPVLTASAPLRQSCTEATAAFVRRGIVERTITSNGQQLRVPAGFAAGWSCASQAEADAAFAAAAEKVQ